MAEVPETKQLSMVTANGGPDCESVRMRAYELYVERGMEDGHDVEDWLHAEEELMSRSVNAAAVAA